MEGNIKNVKLLIFTCQNINIQGIEVYMKYERLWKVDMTNEIYFQKVNVEVTHFVYPKLNIIL